MNKTELSPLEAMPDRCDQCRYFRRREDAPANDNGSCRRYPPVLIHIDGDVAAAFPSVSPAISCGEFSPVLH